MQRTYIRWTKHGEPYEHPILDTLADADPREAHQIEDEDLSGLLRDLYPHFKQKTRSFS